MRALERAVGPLSSDQVTAARELYNTVVARAVERFAAEPERLTRVLLMLGNYMSRSLTVGRGDRRVAAVQDHARERETIERRTRHLETLSDAAREFAALSGNIEPLLTLVARRIGEIALDNLFSNAWKLTAKHDGAEIWFGADGGTFHIRDTGVGFDMAYADQLFVPFHRLHCAEDYEGSGIGLATVQRVVTLHGGRIWAEATAGAGATFFFTLAAPHARAE